MDKKKLQKKIDKFTWLVIPLFVISALLTKNRPLVSALLILFPGVFYFSYAIYFKEFETQFGSYKDARAVIMSLNHFLIFFAFGIPWLMISLGITIPFDVRYLILGILISSFLPHIIIHFMDKHDKNRKISIKYWTQDAKFDTTDGDEVSYQQAVELFDTFDWEKELALKKEREAKKKEGCPPGIAFITDRGLLFHAYSENQGLFKLHLELPVKSWIKARKTIESTEIDKRTVLFLLKLFFEQDYAALELNTNKPLKMN